MCLCQVPDGPYLYPVVYHCNLFKIETINREQSILPTGRCGGRKNVLLQALALATPLSRQGGGGEGSREVPGGFVVVSIISFGVRRLSSKTIKTGLNCRQDRLGLYAEFQISFGQCS